MDTFEAAAFRSGVALAHLTFATTAADLPQALWRDRLELAAAEVCLGHTGRREGAGALRDALHLTKAGDEEGPAGLIFGYGQRSWRGRCPAHPAGCAVKVRQPLMFREI